MKRLIGIALIALVGAGLVVFGVAAANPDEYRVRAIFDNANQLTVGEEVRTAGVTIGVVETLDVTEDNKAAVVLRIDNPDYRDFTSTARCIIRPQSLIGEQYVDCSLMRPVGSAEAPPAKLQKIPAGPGEGQYLLPVENTSSPVGVDLINDIMRVPERQRFSVILNEFGVGLAGNGAALNDVIRRANPALQETDLVLAKLANQNQLLARLADESAASLGPLARERASIASFIRNSEKVAAASHERSADLQANFSKLPAFLAGLTPTMNELSSFSKSLDSFLTPLQPNSSSINSLVSNLPALANYSGIALAKQFPQPAASPGDPSDPAACKSTATKCSLGQVALTGDAVLTDTNVLTSIHGLDVLAKGLNPFANNLGGFLDSIKTTGGWEFLMQLVYAASGNANGFNETGHYGRGLLMLNPDTNSCVTPNAYRSPFTYGGCSANWDGGVLPEGASSASVRKAAAANVATAASVPARTAAPAAGAPASAPKRSAKPSGAAKSPLLEYLLGGAGR